MNLGRKLLLTAPTLIAVLAGSSNALRAQAPGGFVYVANEVSNDVSAYTIDATGTLSFVGNFAAGMQPRGIAVDLSGQFVYVANQLSNNVSAYTINGTTGALASVPGSPFAAGAFATGVSVHPTGQFAYVSNCEALNCFFSPSGSVSVYTIDASTGALTQIPGSPFAAGGGPASIVVDPTGQFAYTANRGSGNVSAYTIEGTTGALTPVTDSPFTAGGQPFGATMDPGGQFLYVTNLTTNNISAYAVNGASGGLTPVAGSPFPAGNDPVRIAVHPTGQFAYAANCGDINCASPGSVSAYMADSVTGALAQIIGSPFAAGTGATGVGVDPSGQFLYVSNFNSGNVTAYSIDGATGALSLIGSITAGNGPVALVVTAGPPPPPATAARK